MYSFLVSLLALTSFAETIAQTATNQALIKESSFNQVIAQFKDEALPGLIVLINQEAAIVETASAGKCCDLFKGEVASVRMAIEFRDCRLLAKKLIVSSNP